MRKIAAFAIVALIALTAVFSVAPDAAKADGQAVRVELSVGSISKITVTLSGAYLVGDTSIENGTLTAEVHAGNVSLSHSSVGALTSDVVVTVTAQSGDAMFTLNNSKYGTCSYRGDLLLGLTSEGFLRVVNRVGMASYLYGVVGSELSDLSPEEALKAQTIAAKGFVLSFLGGNDYDIGDTSSQQAYKGVGDNSEFIRAAVDAVLDQTLTQNDTPVKTYYCAANGGQTLTPAMRWGGSGDDGVYDMRYDPYDLAGSSSALIITLTADPFDMPQELYSAFLTMAAAQDATITELTTLNSVKGYFSADSTSSTETAPTDRAPQERATASFTALTDSGTTVDVTVWFSPYGLIESGAVTAADSNVWFVQPQAVEGRWELIYAKSSGHRVGMSNRGMLEMARQGVAYTDILAFYYPGAELTTDAPISVSDDAAQPEITPDPNEEVTDPSVTGVDAPSDTLPIEVTIVPTVPNTTAPVETPAPEQKTIWQILFGWLGF